MKRSEVVEPHVRGATDLTKIMDGRDMMMSNLRKTSVGMVAALGMIVMASAAAYAASAELSLTYRSVTGKPIPAAVTIGELSAKLPNGFAPDWESLRILDASGKELPFQIDDMDLSEGTSPDDEVAFLTSGSVKASVSDSSDGAPTFPSSWTSMETDDKTVVMTKDGQVSFSVDGYGIVRLNMVAGKQKSWAGNLGLIRYAGWPESTYWANKDLAGHWEATTLEEKPRVIASALLTDTPVRATALCLSESNRFVGLQLLSAVSVYATGDVRVKSTVVSRGYTDLTKLQFIATDILADFGDGRHILPVQRYLDWAEEQGKSVAQYWKDQNALMTVDGRDYAAFADTTGPKPLFWGASYIFGSPERWRTNYSEKNGAGLAEMLVDVPAVSDSLNDKLRDESWILEGEWRTGHFRWVASEIVDNRKNNGIAADIDPDMVRGDWSIHLIPRTKISHTFYYVPYDASSAADAVRFLEVRYTELGSPAISN